MTEAREGALAAYQGYLVVTQAAEAAPNEQIENFEDFERRVEKYARDPIRFQTLLEVRDLVLDGQVHKGSRAHNPNPVPDSSALRQKPPLVVIEDCVDNKNLQIVTTKTGEVARLVDPQGEPLDHPYRLTAEVRQYDGRWYVTNLKPRQDQEC